MDFVYDRKQEDVDLVKQLNEKMLTGTASAEEREVWKNGLKGALNNTDLNRIEENAERIAEEIAVMVSVKTWNMAALPRASDYQRILQNVSKIRAGYGIMSDTPPVPKQPLNTYQKWNDIEKILYGVHYVYTHVQADLLYCGAEVYAGEGVGLL